MKTTFILTIFSAVMLLSCGKSKYEKEMDQWEKEFDKAMEEYDDAVRDFERELDSWNY